VPMEKEKSSFGKISFWGGKKEQRKDISFKASGKRKRAVTGEGGVLSLPVR